MANSASSYIEKNYWHQALSVLRQILLKTELKEEIKWGTPHYTLDGKILIGIAGFKSYFGLWFHQGVFLSDPKEVLVNAQEGTTKALRQWRFHSIDEIDEKAIKQYVGEAILNHKAGKELKPQAKPMVMDELLEAKLKSDVKLQKCFDALTPGKQKEYAEHVGSAKKTETKQRRLEKIIPMIQSGRGLNDRYK